MAKNFFFPFNCSGTRAEQFADFVLGEAAECFEVCLVLSDEHGFQVFKRDTENGQATVKYTESRALPWTEFDAEFTNDRGWRKPDIVRVRYKIASEDLTRELHIACA